MQVIGLLGFSVLAIVMGYVSLMAARAGEVVQAILVAVLSVVLLGSVIHMNTRREMSPEDRERFGPSAAWGGKFFWRVYLNSRPRKRK